MELYWKQKIKKKYINKFSLFLAILKQIHVEIKT
jgi:hypothetical protein